MDQNEPKTAGEESLLEFVEWIVSLDENTPEGIERRRRVNLGDIIIKAKIAKNFYKPKSKRELVIERIQTAIPIIEDEDGAPFPEEFQRAVQDTVPEAILEEFETEFYMLLDEDD